MRIPLSPLPRSACRKVAKRPEVRRRNQQVAVFCHLGQMLWQLARHIPWSRLTEPEREAVRNVADRIADAAEKASQACAPSHPRDAAKAASERG